MDTTRCVSGQTLSTFAAPAFNDIATEKLTFTDSQSTTAGPYTSTSANTPSVEGAKTDPILNSGCRTMSTSTPFTDVPPEAVYTFPITSAVTLVGAPYVHVTVSVDNGTSAEIAARLWDVDTSGNETLMSRTVYRITGSPQTARKLAFELWPNAWQLQAGHTLKLELTQDDSPVFHPDNEPSSVTYTAMSLTLPVVAGTGSGGGVAVPESPLMPALPGVAFLAIAGAALVARRRIGR